MILVQSDRERVVGRKDEFCVSLPPIPTVVVLPKKEESERKERLLDTSDIHWGGDSCLVDWHG